MSKLFLLLTVLLLIFSQLSGQPSNDDLRLWYTNPAEKWLEALPIGNGSLGGMIFGGEEREHIQFNEESLITGTTQTVGFYQPFGDIYLDFPTMKAENYRRELNINEAIHQVNFTANGENFKRECFASYPDKVMVILAGKRFESELSW